MNMFASNGTTLRGAYDEVQQEALNAWNDKREVTKSSFTNLFTLDTDETATVQRYYTDISTYVAEQVACSSLARPIWTRTGIPLWKP